MKQKNYSRGYNDMFADKNTIIAVAGPTAVGKTNLSLNLAVQLVKRGKKVVVFDADFGLANIEVMLSQIYLKNDAI